MKKLGRTYESNIIFVAFDAKEHSMAGSDSFWKLIEYGFLKDPVTGRKITKDKIEFMANIDQIGSSLAPVSKDRKDYIIMLGTSSLKRDKRDLLQRCNMEEDIGLDISLDYYGSANFTKIFYRLSDQKIFVDNRMPAVLFTSGITMNNNKTWDRTENLDIDVYRKRISLMYHWIEKML
jgi:Zn-dependent M28 family amino/carboxypeptidase